MKKFICLIIVILGMTVSFADNKADNSVSNVASALHEDITGTVSTVYNDSKNLVSTIYGDSKELLSTVYPEVKKAVEAIASAIGVAAEHLYTVLVKKYFVDGITDLFFCIVAIIFLGIGWYKLEKYVNNRPLLTKEDGSTYEAPINWRILYPICILAVGFFIAIKIQYHDMLINLINPEWGAINYILETTKSLL